MNHNRGKSNALYEGWVDAEPGLLEHNHCGNIRSAVFQASVDHERCGPRSHFFGQSPIPFVYRWSEEHKIHKRVVVDFSLDDESKKRKTHCVTSCTHNCSK